MPVTDIAAARDAIYTVLNDAWTAQSTPPLLVFDDVVADPSEAAAYAEAFIRHTQGFPAAIGDTGKRRFRAVGELTVSVFTPQGDGLTTSDNLVKIVQDAYETKHGTAPDEVTFRNVRVQEMGKSGAHQKVNVVVAFEYDRIQ